MIKSIKNIQTISLKTKLINILMISGKKISAEKLLLNFVKKIQKSSKKYFQKLIQLAIIYLTPTFKLNESIIKKGKRKAINNSFSFIRSDVFRVQISFKSIRDFLVSNKKSNQSYIKLVEEVLLASNLKGNSVDKKTELQNRILVNKRYLSKFHW